MMAKITVILIALWTMIQALGYGTMAIYAILAHSCQIAMVDSKLSQLLYAIYFRDNACGPVDWSDLLNHTLPVEPKMPDVNLIAFRTNVIAIVYLALSILWLLTSFLLIVGALMSCLSKCGYYFLFHPWIYASLLNIILDVTGTAFFIYDLVNSFAIKNLLSILEVENANEIIPHVDSIDRIFMLPSIIMIIGSIRAIVIWIFNIGQIFIVVRMGKELVSGVMKQKKKSFTAPQHVDYITENERNQEQYNSSTQLTEQMRYNDPQHQYDNFGQEYGRIQKLPKVNEDQPERKRISDQYQYSEEHMARPRLSSNSRNNTEAEPKRGKMRSSSTSKDERRSSGNDRNYFDHGKIHIERPHFRAPKPIKPRPINLENTTETGGNSRRISANPPEELRSQLPWSYFNSPTDISGPKKPFQHLRADEDLPPVPVPDYTMHFPRKERMHTVSDDGSWTGPEYRY